MAPEGPSACAVTSALRVEEVPKNTRLPKLDGYWNER